MQFPPEQTYGQLPERFFKRTLPTRVKAPKLIKLNRDLATELGLDPDFLASPDGVEILAGNKIASGSDPIAVAYAGHQFGQFVPQLGDGRAILLGEVIDRNGKRRDIQLKGSGPTPFSRRGDGRAALGPVLREYMISEAMAALGIPTTRALAAVLTGEQIARETWLPGAIFTRVASSHIRVGTFQFFAARGDIDGTRALADHVIARHYPAAAGSSAPYLALLEAVIAAQAYLVAKWLSVGFIHGVMNTDNMSVAGETIDYGPCAFMDAYDPATVFSSIDHGGRYAYANQPPVARWNLTRFAETLVPLLATDQNQAVFQAHRALDAFEALFQTAWLTNMRAKLGLTTEHEGDTALVKDLFDLMAQNGADFTKTFRALGEAAAALPGEQSAVRDLFIDPTACDRWIETWRERLSREPQDGAERRAAMHRVNPIYIPRNHQVEAAIEAAVARNDFTPFEDLLAVLAAPYAEQPGATRYAEPPPPELRVYKTFCGT